MLEIVDKHFKIPMISMVQESTGKTEKREDKKDNFIQQFKSNRKRAKQKFEN